MALLTRTKISQPRQKSAFLQTAVKKNMYHEYFGLQEQAFSIAVNPRYLYMSQQHREALAHLIYGVDGGGFVLLTGEVGTGKTTIIRCLLEQMPENTDIAIVLNPMSNVTEILSTICDELGIGYSKSKENVKALTDALHQYLLANHSRGRNTVLLIDEAQLLSAEVLEQVRLLTNLETTTQKLLQIILVGQPELNDLLAQPRLRQLSQRITAKFHLQPLSVEETSAYINHRLKIAGMPEQRNPFTPKVIKRIHKFTGGIPRLINILCERILVGAYGHNKMRIDMDIFDLAKREVVGGNQQRSPAWVNKYWNFVSFGVAGTVTLMLGFLVFNIVLGKLKQPESTDHAIAAYVAPPANSSHKNTSSENDTETENIKESAPDVGSDLAFQEQSKLERRDDINITLATEKADSKGSQNNETDNQLAQTHFEPLDSTPRNKSQPSYQIHDFLQAQIVYFEHLELPITEESHPCWYLAEQNIQCKKITLQVWSDVEEIDRPAILTLNTEDKFLSHAILIGINKNEALLLQSNGEQTTFSLNELGRLWTGEIFYAWQPPQGYSEPIALGNRSKAVTWVAEQFALLDGQPSPLTKNIYNRALRERVKIFQRNRGLKDDGIIGEQTLMKLNDAIGNEKTLVHDFQLTGQIL